MIRMSTTSNHCNYPYPECSRCVALPFCNKVKGTVSIDKRTSWCNAKYRLDKALELAKLPKQYLRANIYNYKVDNDNQETYDKIFPFINNIVDEIDGGLNVCLVSKNSGTGKTFTAAMFLNHFIYKTCITSRFDFETPLAMFVEYAEFIHHARYRDQYEDIFQEFELMQQVPLLLLDDVGAGTMTDFAREQTYLLLNERYNAGLSNIVTSNFFLSDLKKDELLGKRCVSRISNNLLYLELKGKDRRVRLRG